MSKTRVLLIPAVVVMFALSAGSSTARAEPPLQLTLDANSVWVRAGESPVLRYRYAEVPFKPYVKELYTPGGVNVLLDAPPDHLHHHALMFACAVNHVDFWGEAVVPAGGHFEPVPGKQVHERLAASHPSQVGPGPLRPPFEEWLRWTHKGQKDPLLLERRTITVRRAGEPEATLLTWECELAVPPERESVTLSGSHYHGLGLRFIRSMDATGEFRNPDNDPGTVFRGEERLARSRWCAYTAQAEGKPVTVAMFDDPNNLRHPATWFMMAKPFAYMSATLRLHEEPLKVSADTPLTLRYGVALWDRRIETPQIEALYRQWLVMTTNLAK